MMESFEMSYRIIISFFPFYIRHVTTLCTGLEEDGSSLIDADGASPDELNLIAVDVANLINADVLTLL